MNKMNEIEIKKDYIKIPTPQKPKKITATKVSQILGIGTAGMYTTPFQVWCDICRVYTKPFEENKYTLAGKEIEPKQAEYVKNKYHLDNLRSPREFIGPVADSLWDFFPKEPIFGGKWDFVTVDKETNDIRRIIECKTAQSKKKKDWDGRIPSDYMVQAGLYAYLHKVDGVTFIVSFLDPSDYETPELYVPNEDNTIITQMFMSKNYPLYEEQIIKPVLEWWNKHVVTGISPKFNEYIAEDLAILEQIKPQVEKPTLF